jgi:ammonia channel protein AmtB
VVLLGSVELGSSLLTGTISGPTGNCVTRGMNDDDSPDAIGTFVMCGIRGGIPYDAL